MKIKIVLFVLIVFTASLQSESLTPSDFKQETITGLGIGTGVQFYFAALSDSTYKGIRSFALTNLLENKSSDRVKEFELALLYGKPFLFNTPHKGFISYAAGLSYSYYNLEDKNKNSTIGIPIDINLVKGISDNIGLGINYTINYNFSDKFINMYLCVYAGDFVNRNYVSHKPKEKWLRVLNDKKREPEKVNKDRSRAFLLNFDLIDNYTRELFSADEQRKSFKGNTGIGLKDFDVLLCFNYIYSNRNSIISNYDKFIFAGPKIRKHSNSNGSYFDLGILHYRAHSREDRYGEKNWRDNSYLSFGLGYKIHLNKHLTICSQINLDIPVFGDSIKNPSILSYKEKDYAIYMELFVPGLEFNF